MNNRIRELRKKKNLTMKQLGEILGLAESTISQYETGKREPDLKTLLKISEYFGVSVEYLLGTSDENGFLTPEGFADPEDYEFIKLLGLDDPQKRKDLAPTSSRPISDEDIKFALFGGRGEITDEMYEEVKSFAAFVRQREEAKKKMPQD